MTQPKAWLAEFLLTRAHFSGPTGKPLFSYQVSSSEYLSLIDVLRNSKDLANNSVHRTQWAACYCLFVAEHYRRHYDGSEGGWSWQGFDGELGVEFNPAQHTRLVEGGLKQYWKRPIRMREGGRDLLGSLFLEGGLPWPMVQSSSHGFGRAVKKGIRHYYRAVSSGTTISSLLVESERYIPKTFRNLETRELLAGIVEQLMYLVDKYPLRAQIDPCQYLDANDPEWRKEFPIPLDEANAVSLINDWLKDAEQEKKKLEEEQAAAAWYSCKNQLCGDGSQLAIKSVVTLPESDEFTISASSLTSTRLEMVFYEGERLAVRSGIIYADPEEDIVRIRFPRKKITIQRIDYSLPLNIRLLSNGKAIFSRLIDASELDAVNAPLIFSAESDEAELLGNGSCSTGENRVRVYLPSGMSISPQAEEFGSIEGGAWFGVEENSVVSLGQDRFYINLRSSSKHPNIELFGKACTWPTLPHATYVGWPEKVKSLSVGEVDSSNAFANGEKVGSETKISRYGAISYTLKDEENRTVARRKFGVLPHDFRLTLIPASQSVPAHIDVYSLKPIEVRVSSSSFKGDVVYDGEKRRIDLSLVKDDAPPNEFQLEVFSHRCLDPVVISLPYPYLGVRLIDSEGNVCDKKDLIVDELLGKQLMLYPNGFSQTVFNITFELRSGVERKILERRFQVDAGNTPTPISLFNYVTDIQQILGTVDNQDAFIRMSVDAGSAHLSINIRRYNGRLNMEADRLVVSNISDRSVPGNSVLKAMLLSDPRKKPIDLVESVSGGAGTGCFEIPYRMRKEGPWIIYPDISSALKFRPYLYKPEGLEIDYHAEPHSLHDAVRVFHPLENRSVIDQQIENMTEDLGHSGWQYMADMVNNYSHLPLSTFECWRALSKNPKAVACLLLRLEIDESYCERIRDELAVIWECIPITLWVDVFSQYRSWLQTTGLPGQMVNSLLGNRDGLLSTVVSGYKDLKNYLLSGNKQDLKKLPIELILPGWYQEVRIRNQSDSHWPDELGRVLSEWVFDQDDLPDSIKSLSKIRYTDAVTFLPVFMAYVTAGREKLSSLSQYIPPERLRYLIRYTSDFDRQLWYEPVHAMLMCHAIDRAEHRVLS